MPWLDIILVGGALVLAILSMVKPTYPFLPVAVILLAVDLLVHLGGK